MTAQATGPAETSPTASSALDLTIDTAATGADARHHDVAAPVRTDDCAHIAATTDSGSTPPGESPISAHLAATDANHDAAAVPLVGEEIHTATTDTLISHDASGALAPDAPHLPETVHELVASATELAPLASPLDDYLQYADTSHDAGVAGGHDETASSPLGDYLAAAGVDATTATTMDAADLPPLEVLLTAGQELLESHGVPGSEHDPASQPVDLPAEVAPEQHHQHH
ncbi:hypothetical protein NMD14_10375 [Aeromonas veronii]